MCLCLPRHLNLKRPHWNEGGRDASGDLAMVKAARLERG